MAQRDFFSSAAGWEIGLFIGHFLPPSVSHVLARITAFYLTKTNSRLISVLATNQRVAHPEMDDKQIKGIVTETIQQAGYGYYDLFYLLSRHHDDQDDSFARFAPDFIKAWRTSQRVGRGTILVSGHIGIFDIPALLFARQVSTMQMLTYPHPRSGHVKQNAWRSQFGINATPVNVSNLRRAVNRLRQNGLVITGVEWPDPTAPLPVQFFGRPTRLTLGHVRLAMETGAVLLPVYTLRISEQRYRLELMGEPFQVSKKRGENRSQVIQEAAERILQPLEMIIRRHPEQWFMFHPLWPELLPPGVPHDV